MPGRQKISGERARSAHSTITEARKRAFIEALRATGVFVWAARAASPHAQDRHGGSSGFRDLMAREPMFRAEVEAAIEEANARIEREAVRRAIEGVPRAVYQKGAQAVGADGKPAVETVYSDRLLEVLLRSRIPATYGDRKTVELHGSVDHRHVGLLITPADLVALDGSQRSQLATILRTIAAHRGETDVTPALPAPSGELGAEIRRQIR